MAEDVDVDRLGHPRRPDTLRDPQPNADAGRLNTVVTAMKKFTD